MEKIKAEKVQKTIQMLGGLSEEKAKEIIENYNQFWILDKDTGEIIVEMYFNCVPHMQIETYSIEV